MKKLFLLAILASAISGNAQSLKDALYGGKLKLDSGAVIRKSDDWTSKIDTSTKKPVEPENKKTVAPGKDSSMTGMEAQTDSSSATDNTDANVGSGGVKSNNQLWKDFVEELTGTLRTDVLPSKKIKSGTYSLLIDYFIDTDGQIGVNNVSSSPGNEYLEQQVRERITLSAPKMTPLLNPYGKPRKAPKKYTLVISK